MHVWQTERTHIHRAQTDIVTKNSGKVARMVRGAKVAHRDDGAEEEHSSGDESQSEDEAMAPETVMVHFEGRNPTDLHYNGMRQLLKPLFQGLNINISDMAELIISQNYLGSVLLQTPDDDDDEEVDENYVFGLSTIINLKERDDHPCVSELRSDLMLMCSKHSSSQVHQELINIFGQEEAHPIGLLINERMTNLPSSVATKLFEVLLPEIDRAARKNMPHSYHRYVLVSKMRSIKKDEDESAPGVQGDEKAPDTWEEVWVNPEEEELLESAIVTFDYPVEEEASPDVKDFRRVMVVSQSGVNVFVKKLIELEEN